MNQPTIEEMPACSIMPPVLLLYPSGSESSAVTAFSLAISNIGLHALDVSKPDRVETLGCSAFEASAAQ